MVCDEIEYVQDANLVGQFDLRDSVHISMKIRAGLCTEWVGLHVFVRRSSSKLNNSRRQVHSPESCDPGWRYPTSGDGRGSRVVCGVRRPLFACPDAIEMRKALSGLNGPLFS